MADVCEALFLLFLLCIQWTVFRVFSCLSWFLIIRNHRERMLEMQRWTNWQLVVK